MTAGITKLTEVVNEKPFVKMFNTEQFLDDFFKENAL